MHWKTRHAAASDSISRSMLIDHFRDRRGESWEKAVSVCDKASHQLLKQFHCPIVGCESAVAAAQIQWLGVVDITKRT